MKLESATGLRGGKEVTANSNFTTKFISFEIKRLNILPRSVGKNIHLPVGRILQALCVDYGVRAGSPDERHDQAGYRVQ